MYAYLSGDQQEGDETAARPMTKKMRLENSKTLPFVTSRTHMYVCIYIYICVCIEREG